MYTNRGYFLHPNSATKFGSICKLMGRMGMIMDEQNSNVWDEKFISL